MQEIYRSIRMNELDECLDLWDKAFAHTPRDYFTAYYEVDPCFKPEYTRVCEVDGRLVSAVQICERKIRAGKSVLTLGGIANVGTDPEYRGRGYSSNLLKDSLKVMKDNYIDLSLLYTGINPFYERLGWKTISKRSIRGTISPSISTMSSPTLEPFNWDQDLERLAYIYDAFNYNRSLTIVRDMDYWTSWIDRKSAHGKSFKILKKNGDIAGYIQHSFDEQNCWLNEIGYLNSDNIAAELVIAAVKEASAAGAVKLWSRLPIQPDINNVFAIITDRMDESCASQGMCCLINAPSVLNKIKPDLQQNLIASDSSSCNLTLLTSNKSDSIYIEGKASDNVQQITLKSTEFLSWLFDLSHTTENKNDEYLRKLFSPNASASWVIDHF